MHSFMLAANVLISAQTVSRRPEEMLIAIVLETNSFSNAPIRATTDQLSPTVWRWQPMVVALA